MRTTRFHCHSTRRLTGHRVTEPKQTRREFRGYSVNGAHKRLHRAGLQREGKLPKTETERGQRDLHTRERESLNVADVVRKVQRRGRCGERCTRVRDAARDSPPPTDEARRDEPRGTTTSAARTLVPSPLVHTQTFTLHTASRTKTIRQYFKVSYRI